MARTNLEALKQAVLGNERGREVDVSPDGRVILNSEGEQDPANRPEGDHKPKVSKMSVHTFGN